MIASLLLLAAPMALYVSPGRFGDDAATGERPDRPLKSLAVALTRVADGGEVRVLDGEFGATSLRVDGRRVRVVAAPQATPRFLSLSLEAKESEVEWRGLEFREGLRLTGDGTTTFTLARVRGGGKWEVTGAKRLELEDGALRGGSLRVAKTQALAVRRLSVLEPPGDGVVVEEVRGSARLENVLVAKAGGTGVRARRAPRLQVVHATLAGSKGPALDLGGGEVANSIVDARGPLRQGALRSKFCLWSRGEPDEYDPTDRVGEPRFGLTAVGSEIAPYRPLSTSPALGAGGERYRVSGDLTGRPRGPRLDLGCFQVSG